MNKTQWLKTHDYEQLYKDIKTIKDCRESMQTIEQPQVTGIPFNIYGIANMDGIVLQHRPSKPDHPIAISFGNGLEIVQIKKEDIVISENEIKFGAFTFKRRKK